VTILRFIAIALVGAFLSPFAAGLAQNPDPSQDLLSTEQQIASHFDKTPCKTKERLPAVRALFEEMGASAEEISTQKTRGAENLLVTKKGRELGTIVVGAHYDFIDEGCGVVDNWTGIVALAHVYRSVTRMGMNKTIVFAAFDNEEKGLVGSRAMARAIPKAELPQYCGMINIDSLGMGRPFALEQVSSSKMMGLAERSAETMKIPFYKVAIPFTDTDSSSFLDRDIPAVTISALSNEWNKVLHTRRDQKSEAIPASVYLGYRLALTVLFLVDGKPCGEYAERGPRPSLRQ
jgi:hypothetical protein